MQQRPITPWAIGIRCVIGIILALALGACRESGEGPLPPLVDGDWESGVETDEPGAETDAETTPQSDEGTDPEMNRTWIDPFSGYQWQQKSSARTMTWAESMTYCTDLRLGGHTDWRLPTISELRSLIRRYSHGVADCGVTDDCLAWTCRSEACNSGPTKECGTAAEGCCWPSDILGACATHYWSSSTYADYSAYAWGVPFDGGGVDVFIKKYRGQARCLRGGPLASSGVWHDTASGLTWQNPPAPGSFSWDVARGYCANLSQDGHRNWRLPTINELRSLIRGCEAVAPGGDCPVTNDCTSILSCWSSSCRGCWLLDGPTEGCYWPSEMGGTCNYDDYWSSQTDESHGNDAWYLDFTFANLSTENKGQPRTVRCVRN